MAEGMKKIWEQALAIAEKLYLTCRLDVFERARKAANAYQECLYQLKTEHSYYVQIGIRIQDIEDQMEKSGCRHGYNSV
jgi:hypothetical protein